ncbi:alpha/beta hydrolase [Trinickia fusca]|uniref:Esterase family protein n=1 Tax=Trinickia fusca TaxID=2419777 RepID=A0A494X3B2_9BURK|nr:alpha/beta hydrolase-fold protein [Trinickia fusca]RKP45188.1 esterase family protein [Trinickia fusca]
MNARTSALARRLATLVVALAAASLAIWSAHAPASTVQTHTFHSATLRRDWPYTVYLPDGYRSGNAHYPAVYLLHGNGGNANDWLTQGHLQSTADALIARGAIPPVVIVMPQGGTDWYVDRKEPIETAFFEDLLPEIESRYAVAAQREARVIGGVSMGGFGALRYALLAPEQFCGVLLLSPAIYADLPPRTSAARRVGVFGSTQFDASVWHKLNYPALWDAYMNRPWRPAFFIGAGDDDLPIQSEADSLYTRLRQAGNPASLRIVGGGHTWQVWRELLEPALIHALACTKARGTH